MRIDVTAEDIEKGFPDSPCFCPIALAVKRIKPSYVEVLVGRETIIVGSYLAGSYSYILPTIARDFIRRFDMGYGEIGPFSFEV